VFVGIRRLLTNVTGWLAAGAGSVALLAACGANHSLDPRTTAKYVGDVVFQQTGYRAVDVRCPSGIPAARGGRFRCHFTGPEGPYTAYLRVVNVHGRSASFQLKTQPSSWPPPSLR
jgi:hypothetical protein